MFALIVLCLVGVVTVGAILWFTVGQDRLHDRRYRKERRHRLRNSAQRAAAAERHPSTWEARPVGRVLDDEESPIRH